MAHDSTESRLDAIEAQLKQLIDRLDTINGNVLGQGDTLENLKREVQDLKSDPRPGATPAKR